MRSKLLVAATMAAALLVPAGAYSAAASASALSPASVPPAIPGTSSNFELVGCCPSFGVSVLASLVVSVCGHEPAPPAGAGGAGVQAVAGMLILS